MTAGPHVRRSVITADKAVVQRVQVPPRQMLDRTRSDATTWRGQPVRSCVVYRARLPRACKGSAVGATGGLSEHGSLNMSEWLQPRNRTPCRSCIAGIFRRAERVRSARRPLPPGKTSGTCTRWTPRGTGPGDRARITGNNVGKGHLPAGACDNLRRFAGIGRPKPVGGIWSDA